MKMHAWKEEKELHKNIHFPIFANHIVEDLTTVVQDLIFLERNLKLSRICLMWSLSTEKKVSQ